MQNANQRIAIPVSGTILQTPRKKMYDGGKKRHVYED